MSIDNRNLRIKLLSSLDKVFADEDLENESKNKGSMLSNEVYTFQAAYYWEYSSLKNVKVRINSELSSHIKIRTVELIPVEMPRYSEYDNHILRDTPGLYPDLLQPISEEGITLLPDQWRSLWLTIDPKEEIAAGNYSVEIIFEKENGEELGRDTFNIEIIDEKLPQQELVHTEWFHSDCLATWYECEVFSEEYWQWVDKYIEKAVEHGINMILTPIFTPPLDTEKGGERPTVQLIDVLKKGKEYEFGFEKLKRWIDLCRQNGVTYFEFSHLFTQWGAEYAPKIIADVEGKEEKIFGWETEAASKEYRNFLDQLLPELIDFIEKEGLKNCSYFHVSDEPSLENWDSYKKATEIINKHLEEYPVIDALSNYDFYEKGLVKNPIPANNHIDTFIENDVPDLWTYYCTVQYMEVSNRFMHMPSARNRIIGTQMYKFNIKGFLHWGFNFWYSQYSRYPIDPFRVTHAGYWVLPGDAFLVYPGAEGPLESIRMEVFYEGLQDLRALKLLEEKIGRNQVVKILEKDLEQSLTFKQYPRRKNWLIDMREKINRKIKKGKQ